MPQESVTIVPVTLHSVTEPSPSTTAIKAIGHCTIKLTHAEIVFHNGVEERIVQMIVRELMDR